MRKAFASKDFGFCPEASDIFFRESRQVVIVQTRLRNVGKRQVCGVCLFVCLLKDLKKH